MSDIQLITISNMSNTGSPNQLKTYQVMDDNSLRVLRESSAQD